MDFIMFNPSALLTCVCVRARVRHASMNVCMVPEDNNFSGSTHPEDHGPSRLADEQAPGILLPQPLIYWYDRLVPSCPATGS